MDLCQPVALTGLNWFKPGKTEFMPASGINLFNFSWFKPWFKPGGLNHLPTLLQPTAYHLTPATYHLQPTTYNLPPTTYHLQPTTYNLLLTTYNVPVTTY